MLTDDERNHAYYGVCVPLSRLREVLLARMDDVFRCVPCVPVGGRVFAIHRAVGGVKSYVDPSVRGAVAKEMVGAIREHLILFHSFCLTDSMERCFLRDIESNFL